MKKTLLLLLLATHTLQTTEVQVNTEVRVNTDARWHRCCGNRDVVIKTFKLNPQSPLTTVACCAQCRLPLVEREGENTKIQEKLLRTAIVNKREGVPPNSSISCCERHKVLYKEENGQCAIVCFICGKTLDTSLNQKAAEKKTSRSKHNNNSSCPFCGKVFRKDNLKRHINNKSCRK